MDPRWRLALAWLAGFTLIDSSIVSLALPDIANDFDQSVGQLAWVSTGYLIALAATLLAAGRLSDRYGQRPVLTLGGIGFFAATAACGMVPTYELLVASRVIQGIFGGILYTVSLAITVTAFPPERRSAAIGIYFTSGALGAVIGPVVGGFLTDLGGWRLVFFAQLPLPAAVAIGAVVLLPHVTRRTGSFDVAGIAAASIVIVALTLGMLQLAEPGGAPITLVAGLVAIGGLIAFVRIERRVADPAVRLDIFGNRRFVVATAAGAGAWFAIMSATIYTAIYLQLGRGFSPADAGLILLAAPLVALVWFPLGGRFVGAVGVDRALLLGVLLTLLGSSLMLTWGADTPVWWVVAVGLISGAGVAVTLVASATDALAQFRPEDAGTGSALFNSLRQLGAAMGVAIPAVAFELVAAGSRSEPASLAGSTAAFLIRTVVLAIPLALVLAGRRSRVEVAPAESG